jgi:hypothetical protein
MLGPWGAAAGAVGGAAMGIIGSQKANKAAKKAEEAKRIEQDRVIAETRKRATQDYLTQVRLEQLQKTQEETAIAEKAVDITRQRDETVGTAVSSAAERGVDGRTVDQIVADYHFQASQETGRLYINQAMKNQQHGENMNQFEDQYGQRFNSQKAYQKKPIAPVDYFSPIFGAVGDLGKIAMASGAGKTGGSLPTSTAPAAVAGYPTDTQDG